MTETTHRPSFASRTIANAFWNVSLDGEIYLDDLPSTYTPDWVIAASAEHDRDGSHPECVICKLRARREWEAEVDAQTADAADLLATQESAL
jgi:hypothetical protein